MLLQCELQGISKGRNSGFWVAPKIYCSKTQKTLDGNGGWWYNKYHQVRRTHKNAEGEIKMENKVYTQEEVNEICTQHEAWLKDWHTGKRADFSGANLRGLHLEGRSLRKANFQRTDLTGAFLKSADFDHANFEGANLTFVRASYAKFNDCMADHACFDEAHLTGTYFEGASLQRASFRKAQVNFASFREAKLWRADFVDAITGGTIFARANLEFAAFNSGFAGNNFDDRQIAEFAYNLCTAVLGGHTNSPEVKETVRKILSLANRAESVKVFGRVQEYRNGQYITAKEAE
jgi:hypothetical protein